MLLPPARTRGASWRRRRARAGITLEAVVERGREAYEQARKEMA
jgi:hypothetical protein